jgi:Uma2 family endonuclease
MATVATTSITPEEYLEFERRAEVKHEYRDGEIVEMPGSSYAHDCLAANLIGLLYQTLAREKYGIRTSDMRIKVSETGLYTYADASVVIGEAVLEGDRGDLLLNPAVIFEILSPSTETYDRGEKFNNYATIESLREYVLVAQDTQRIERYSRNRDSAEWSNQVFDGPDAIVELTSIGCSLNLSDLYYKVPLGDSAPS